MKGALIAALTASLVTGSAAGLPGAVGQPPGDPHLAAVAGQAQRDRSGPCSEIRWRDAYYREHRLGPVKELVRCAVRLWPVDGGVTKAFSVISCESGFRPDAFNAGGYGGVMQHALRYWPTRARNLLNPAWGISRGWRSARANVLVGIRMAHSGGWSSWGCA